MIIDGNPSHTAKLTDELAKQYGITILWLPKRDPHSNPMDHLWRHAKAARCGNRPYVSIDKEVKSVIHYLLSLTDQEALRKAGILSEHFWLK
jgi:transposase